MSAARRLVDLLLSAAAGVGSLVLVLALAGPWAGLHVARVRTGSMTPTIPAESLVLTHRVAVGSVRPGEVVTVDAPSGHRVTHRVVARRGHTLVLKGDANRAPDPVPYRIDRADRVLVHIPHLGAVAGFARTAPGRVGLLVLVLVLLSLLLCPELLAPAASTTPPGPRRRRRPRVLRGAAMVVALVLAALLGPAQVRPLFAAGWGDVTPATSTVLAYRVAPTTTACGPLQLLRATVVWTPSPDATGYVVHYGLNGALTDTVQPDVSSKTMSLVGTGVFWVEVQHRYAGVTWTSVPSNRKAYVVLANSVGSCQDA